MSCSSSEDDFLSADEGDLESDDGHLRGTDDEDLLGTDDEDLLRSDDSEHSTGFPGDHSPVSAMSMELLTLTTIKDDSNKGALTISGEPVTLLQDVSECTNQVAAAEEPMIPNEIASRFSTRKSFSKPRPGLRTKGRTLGGVKISNQTGDTGKNMRSQQPELKRVQEKCQEDSWDWDWLSSSILPSVTSFKDQLLEVAESGLQILQNESSATGLHQVIGVSDLKNFIADKGSSLLDTFELLGSKAYDFLQQSAEYQITDSQDEASLSQLLREVNVKKQIEVALPTLEVFFQDYNGQVYYRSLQTLSQVPLPYRRGLEFRDPEKVSQMDYISRKCSEWPELEEEDDNDDDDDGSPVTSDPFNKLQECWKSIGVRVCLTELAGVVHRAVPDDNQDRSSDDTYIKSMQAMASVAALSVKMIHEGVVTLQTDECEPDGEREAQALHRIALLICRQINRIAHLFVTVFVTRLCHGYDYSIEIYLNASKSCLYVRNATKLLIPILQSRIAA